MTTEQEGGREKAQEIYEQFGFVGSLKILKRMEIAEKLAAGTAT